jgi:hypothetical protein
VERLANGNTLIADGAAVSGADGRVLEVDSLGRMVWAYVQSDIPFVHTARRLANGNTLITATDSDRVVEVNRYGQAVWDFEDSLDYPNEAWRLGNGNTLITDRNHDRVVEVSPDRCIVWQYAGLVHPHNASRLADGHTLICNSDDNQVVEVDSSGAVFWQYAVNLDWPRCAERLANRNTLIADSRHNRVVEVDWAGRVVWSCPGLVSPYTATRLADGHTLVSCLSGVVEVNAGGSVVWQYPQTVAVLVETLWVVNPASGCSLYAHIHRPEYSGPLCRVPGVVLVPGGNGFGSAYDVTGLADDIASDGFAVLHFDPDGRGLSGHWPEDYDGFVHQDGMHECASMLAGRDYVDTARLGVYSQSYGVTMAVGMIARYSEPRIQFLLDFEGPADRTQTCLDSGGHVPVPADSEAFWREREAARFVKQVPSVYLRIQTQADHNPHITDNRHCIQMIDSATSTAHGGRGVSVWTRVNDSLMNPENRVYSLSEPPAWIPETQESQTPVRVLLYLHELARMTPGAGTGDTPGGQVRSRHRPAVVRAETEGPQLEVRDAAGRRIAGRQGLAAGVFFVRRPGGAGPGSWGKLAVVR